MIRIVNGCKMYTDGDRRVAVLQPFNLLIEKGEFIAIRGRSGSGKSTLLHILGCMDHLNEGEYYFNNLNINANKNIDMASFRRDHFGFVFQSYHLIHEFTALQNVEAPMAYAGIPRKQRKERAQMLLEQVGLKDQLHYYPYKLSGGQQQRVAIARALANQPDVILADEPTGNLDRENGDQVIELLTGLHRQGTTLILVTHADELGQLAEREIHIKDGLVHVPQF